MCLADTILSSFHLLSHFFTQRTQLWTVTIPVLQRLTEVSEVKQGYTSLGLSFPICTRGSQVLQGPVASLSSAPGRSSLASRWYYASTASRMRLMAFSTLALPLRSCVTLEKPVGLSEPWCHGCK
jgi:hypothetical protein